MIKAVQKELLKLFHDEKGNLKMKKKAIIIGLFCFLLLISANAHALIYQGSFTGQITEVNYGSDPLPLTNVVQVGDQFQGDYFVNTDLVALSGGGYAREWWYTINFNNASIYKPDGLHIEDPVINYVNFNSNGILMYDEIPFSPNFPVDILAMNINVDGTGNFNTYYPVLGNPSLRGTFNVNQVPEPSTILLVSAGFVGLGFLKKRIKI